MTARRPGQTASARKVLIFGMIVIASGAASAAFRPARAETLPEAGPTIGYEVVDQSLPNVLAGLAAQIGLRAEISPKIIGRVHGRLEPASAKTTFDRLAGLYGFDWYCVGKTVFFSSHDEAQSKVIALGTVAGGTLLHAVEALGIADSRWPVRISAGGDVALVDGPPRYVALIEQTLSALAQREAAAPALIHVFRGSRSGA